MEWVKIRSQDVCEGNRLLQEIKIFRDWTFTVFVNNRQICKDTLGNPAIESSKKMLTYLFNVVANYNLCKGFQVPFKKTAKDLKGKTTAITEEWCSRDDGTVSLYLRSVECRVLVSNYKRSCNVLCDHCATVKRNNEVRNQNQDLDFRKFTAKYLNFPSTIHVSHTQFAPRNNRLREMIRKTMLCACLVPGDQALTRKNDFLSCAVMAESLVIRHFRHQLLRCSWHESNAFRAHISFDKNSPYTLLL